MCVMTQSENSQQRHNLGEIVLTSLDSRGLEWHKRVSNFVGNDMGSISTTQWNIWYIYDRWYTSATQFGNIGKKGEITSNLWCNTPQGMGKNGSPTPLQPSQLVK